MKLLPIHVAGARAVLKMTQAELANAAGVSEDTIRYFESERTEPKVETLYRIQLALEKRGIEFLNDGEPGVRLRPSKAVIHP